MFLFFSGCKQNNDSANMSDINIVARAVIGTQATSDIVLLDMREGAIRLEFDMPIDDMFRWIYHSPLCPNFHDDLSARVFIADAKKLLIDNRSVVISNNNIKYKVNKRDNIYAVNCEISSKDNISAHCKFECVILD